MIARSGIQRLAIWDKANTPSSVIAMFQRGSGTMTVTEKEDIKDYRNRVIPSMTNVKIEATEFGVGRPLLYYLNVLAQGDGCSAEVVGVKTASTKYDGIYKFLGSSGSSTNHLGLDFEYTATQKERSAKITLEASFEWEAWKSILGASIFNDAANVRDLTPTALTGYDPALMQAPQFNGMFTTYPNRLFENEELIDYKLTVKTAGSKTIYDRTIVDALEVMLEMTVARANKDDLKTLFEVSGNQAFTLGLGYKSNAGWAQETHIFNQGTLGLTRTFELGDDKRTVKLMLGGKLAPTQLAYNTAGNGIQYTYSL